MSTTPLPSPAPTVARLSIDANHAGPILAAMIGRILSDAGAKVAFTRADITPLNKPIKSLEGLTVVIDRVTWVRDEEAARWEEAK